MNVHAWARHVQQRHTHCRVPAQGAGGKARAHAHPLGQAPAVHAAGLVLAGQHLTDVGIMVAPTHTILADAALGGLRPRSRGRTCSGYRWSCRGFDHFFKIWSRHKRGGGRVPRVRRAGGGAVQHRTCGGMQGSLIPSLLATLGCRSESQMTHEGAGSGTEMVGVSCALAPGARRMAVPSPICLYRGPAASLSG